MSQPIENIIKQGYLKKGNSGGNRLSGLLKKIEGFKWFVFTIKHSIPYLEYYDNDSDVFRQRPISTYCLSQCRNITSFGRSNPPTFSIACADRFIELIASSRPQMLEWVRDIENTLSNLGILKKESAEHVYTVLPAVVRQPRVCQEVLDERASMTPVFAPVSIPSRLSTPQVVVDGGPPPLPQRPPPLNTDQLSATNDTSDTLLGTSPPNVHCSNDSDFVSWAVLMEVRKNHLEVNALDNTGSGEGASVEDEQFESDNYDNHPSVSGEYMPSSFQIVPTNRLEEDDSLDLSTLPSLFPSVSSESDVFGTIEHIDTLREVEQNDYSLLPVSRGVSEQAVEQNEYSLLPVSRGVSEQQQQVEMEEGARHIGKPVPLPRRTLSLKSNTFEKNKLRNAESNDVVCSEDGNIFQLSETKELNGMSSNSIVLPSGNYKENTCETDLNDSQKETKDENENFPVFKNVPKSFRAPPAIPLRCDSLSGSTSTVSSPVCNQDFSYSHRVSSSRAQSFNRPSPSFSPAIPPLPLPRRKTTKATSTSTATTQDAFHFNNDLVKAADTPPMLPRRTLPKSSSLPEDSPPALPSRNSRMSHQLSLSIAKGNECSSYAQEPQAWNGSLSDKSVTLGASAAPNSRQSGLSKKMLLDRANSMHTVVSLKQTQAELLQAEIDKPHINVTLTQKSGHGIALVDWNSMPCVVGWNQKDFPSLHGKLHIGDLLVSVNHVRVASSDAAQKLLRHASEPKIEVVLQRMPYARVFGIRRSAEGQNLGLKREGGTAEILYVDPNGLAASHGLPQYAPGTMGKARCTWFLTEINSRPLNLFFKENEIEHRLQAVGKEISIVVQPSDFILEMRHGLKKSKNYKNYIIQ